MKRILFLLLILAIIPSCSKETATPTPEPTPKFSVSISVGEGGSVSTEGGTYDKGTKLTVTATPDGEYLFDSWSDGSTENPREITVTSNLNLTANFVKKKYNLTVNIDGEGTVEEEVIVQGSNSNTEYNSGTTVKLTAIASEGWEFVQWDGDIESPDNPIEVTLSETKDIQATFAKKSILTEYIDKPTVFLPLVNSYFSEKLNLKQYKQPIWNYQNYVFNEQELLGANDWAIGSDYLVGDWNLDGFNDIFMVTMTGAERENVPFQIWLYDDSAKTLVNNSNLINNNSGQSFSRKSLTGDLNGDGIPDFVSVSHPEISSAEFSYLDVVLSEGSSWTQYTLSKVSRFIDNSPESGYYHGVDLGDVDNDGDIDILVAMWHNDDKGMTLFRNDGSGSFIEENNSVKVLDDDNRFEETMSFTSDLIDINEDGCLDLAVGWNPTIIKYGNCDGTFGPNYIGEFYAGSHGGILSYDLDLDNDDDLIFRAETDGQVSVQIYLNNIDSYSLEGEYPVSMGEPFDIKDVNLDGYVDIIGRDPFGSFADPNLQDGSVGYWRYDKNTFLMGKENLEFEVVEIPPITLIQDINFENDNNALVWSFAFMPKGNDVTPAEAPHLSNLRGGVDEWFIYYKETPFYFVDDTQVIIIKYQDIPIEMLHNNTFRCSYTNNNLKEGFYRIGYKDLNGIIYPPSYEIRLYSN